MQGCQHDLASAHQVAHALLLALAVLLPELLEVLVDLPPLPALFVFLIDACLASISAWTSLTMAPASDVCVKTSREWFKTDGSSRAGCRAG